METKSTGDLQQELMEQPNLNAYIRDNQEEFSGNSMLSLLSELFTRKNLSKAEAARQAGISEVYLHQVFSGRRKPSRDRLLCICLGVEATLDEVQRLLKQAGYAPLYPRRKREAIVAHGIVHHTPLREINDKLFIENEKTLF